MKTIELKAGQQIAQFTTKSVTFDGKEFFYSRMSNLTHDPATQKYYFTYDGESKILPYEAKDAQILTAIFSQVLKLQAAKAAQAHAAKMPAQTAQQTPQAPVQDQAQQEEIPVTPQTPHAVDVRAAAEMAQPAPEPAEQAPAAGQATAAEQASAEEPIVFTDKKAAKQAEKERKKAEKAAKRAEKERLKAEKAAKKAGKVTEPETPAEGGSQSQETGAQTSDLTGTPAESAAEPKELTDEEKTAKKTKLKKSLLIFAAVLVIVAALSVAAYFIFGTSNNPSSNNPGSKESQQYDDIDELINDLQ
ncbi:MAG: hypothetical protein U0K74_03465 [Clostridia bacterium]|nr:hypothetical protein [Clostridia bacterium]